MNKSHKLNSIHILFDDENFKTVYGFDVEHDCVLKNKQ